MSCQIPNKTTKQFESETARIQILQEQIDNAKESGEEYNILGTVLMSEQIIVWEREIKKSEKILSTIEL